MMQCVLCFSCCGIHGMILGHGIWKFVVCVAHFVSISSWDCVHAFQCVITIYAKAERFNLSVFVSFLGTFSAEFCIDTRASFKCIV